MTTPEHLPANDAWIATRASLLSRLKDWADQKSWNEFFETYGKLVFNVALKSGLTHAEAQDVVQETMLSVAKKMPDFKYNPAVGSFKGFLLHMTRWRIADQFRKRTGASVRSHVLVNNEPGTDLIQCVPDPAGLELEKTWDSEWERNLLETALDRVRRRVNPKHYQLFDLFVTKGWSVEEIVATMGVTTHQVYTAKSRISVLLKKEIERLRTLE